MFVAMNIRINVLTIVALSMKDISGTMSVRRAVIRGNNRIVKMKTTKKRSNPSKRRRRCYWCGRLVDLSAYVKDGPYAFCDNDCLGASDEYEELRSKRPKPDDILRGILGAVFGAAFAVHVVAPVSAVIPAEMFKKMLFLCHPDKHNNSVWATEVTQWLLEERRKSDSKPV